MTRKDRDAVVVGAGLAGLAAACTLHEAGRTVEVLEAADAVGGRVRSDRHEGFLLDRGFQVYLTSYPEGRRFLDLDALDLRPFYPGSLVRRQGRFQRLADPWRRPLDAVGTLFAPVGGLGDKLIMARLRSRLRRRGDRKPTGLSTAEALRREGFSPAFIDAFFRPFLGGVFLERELSTSASFFDFVMRHFAAGRASLPAGGMGSIPWQMAGKLPEGAIRLEAPVAAVRRGEVELENGEIRRAPIVIVATDGPAYARLLGGPDVPGNGTACLYFDADEPPVQGPILVLDGDGDGPVNNLCVPSAVCPGHAPRGRALVSASTVGVPSTADRELEQAARRQLAAWFGGQVEGWRLLRIYRIPFALPRFPPARSAAPGPVDKGVLVCGDHRDTPSINGALASGRRAAEAALAANPASTGGSEC